ncbi:MAG TPA: phage baseplate assembly protein V [Myxococcales bacterium]|nr:phage baseplate assembly protein V [Myxococcales bacterium]
MSGPPFYGKYRGTVSDVQDTMFLGRIKANVPDVLGDQESGWALPCAPFGGDGAGLFVLPKVGAGVWIEFEHGDPEFPIWAGCWFGASSQVPSDAWQPAPYTGVYLKTVGGIIVSLDDNAGSISFKTPNGQELNLTADAIEIKFSGSCSIKLGSSGVSVNDGALEVL